MELIREVHPVTGQDAEQVADLEQVYFSESWSENLIRMGLDNRLDTYFIYASHGATLRYAVVQIPTDKGEVQQIGICPNYRRRGIVRELMDVMAVFARARGVRAIALEVQESSLRARKLYDSHGFRQEVVKEGYHHNPTKDTIIMWNRTI